MAGVQIILPAAHRGDGVVGAIADPVNATRVTAGRRHARAHAGDQLMVAYN